MKKFTTDCIHSTAELIDAMVDYASEISNDLFIKEIGIQAYEKLEKSLGYCKETKKSGLILESDCQTSFYSSSYDGKPCVFVCHSCIEYIFT